MKRIIIASLLMFSSFCNSQTVVSKLGGFMKLYDDNTIEYLDHKFTKIRTYKTIDLGSAENLELFKKTAYKTLEGQNQDLIIEDNQVLKFEYVKVMGKAQFRIFHTVSSGVTGLTLYITKKKLDKLFVKK